jgi:hypothetical protein
MMLIELSPQLYRGHWTLSRLREAGGLEHYVNALRAPRGIEREWQ